MFFLGVLSECSERARDHLFTSSLPSSLRFVEPNLPLQPNNFRSVLAATVAMYFYVPPTILYEGLNIEAAAA